MKAMKTVSLLSMFGVVGLLLGGLTVLSIAKPNASTDPPAAKAPSDAPQWIELFNGRDLLVALPNLPILLYRLATRRRNKKKRRAAVATAPCTAKATV